MSEAGSRCPRCGGTGVATIFSESAWDFEDQLCACQRKSAPAQGQTLWRHKKRGSTVTEVARGFAQVSAHPIEEMTAVVIYKHDGHWWVRNAVEFDDGRFEPLNDPHVSTPAECQNDDTMLIDTLRAESWDLRCFDMPTGGGDADIGWRVVGHWQAEPHERTVGEAFEDDPRAAIRDAIARTSSR